MSSNISTNEAFVVEIIYNDGTHNPDFDTIAQGLSVKEDVHHPSGAWGTASWFDKVSAVMRMCLIQAAPRVERGTYRVRSVVGEEILFLRITKPVYNSVVRHILPYAPELATDAEIQRYISSLNPYE